MKITIPDNNTPTNAMLAETIDHVRAILGEKMDQITVERAVIGLFFTGVKLSDGHGGLCFTPIKEIPEAVCCQFSQGHAPVGQTGGAEGQHLSG